MYIFFQSINMCIKEMPDLVSLSLILIPKIYSTPHNHPIQVRISAREGFSNSSESRRYEY